ncbi:sugar ABC transporter ATP-binding protein [Acidisoma cellulosilytica]|uniref:Sugar ABC transporter ATP-binding protein n=1 Tax=Acidisoma cellulosilyticum TaxID=2802395 RepID=A0A964E5Q9_9PROT|nr:sugar ABC transporter ATP-binding protein [Acidisoma cellulosilyticum]MCB8882781.1 sugar ABC transporter ATP-binding protein [Acidisoma cellulosilyticum]
MSELSVKGLTFAFSSFVALKNVDLSIRSGEIVGIIGENGAGKSTLLNILSGTLHATSGSVTVDGEALAVKNYNEANLKGIWRIFQDPATIPNLRVYENLFLGHESKFLRFGLLNKSAMIQLARKLVADMQLRVDVRDVMHKYDFPTRQALEVGKATLLPSILGLSSGYVLFDEPTTGLTRSEVTLLLSRMRQLKASGAGVAFVSHRLQELFDVCDRIVVLKDGHVVGAGATAEFDEDKLHRMMVGRDVQNLAEVKPRARSDAPPRLVAKDLTIYATAAKDAHIRRAEVDHVSLEIGTGEIVGIGGLLGSGKNHLLRLIAGDMRASGGGVTLDGRPLLGSLKARKDLGIAFVPSDRGREAIVGALSVASNISLASGHSGALGFSNRIGIWRGRHEQAVTKAMIKELAIKASPEQTVGSLSGGNQQKVALAKWIHRDPRVMLIENPTAGVDVGAKVEIYRHLLALAARGTSILYVTDDLPELIRLSDRVLIMRDGGLVANLDNRSHALNEHELVALMIGRSQAQSLH